MYKDKDKQREAIAERQRRYRDWKASGGVTDSERDEQGVTEVINDIGVRDEVLEAEGLKPERTAQGNIRVSKPGDTDYVSESGSESGFDDETSPNRQHENTGLSGSPSGKIETSSTAKRGKDIKCFGDLPMDVQLGILHMSRGEDGKTDQTIKANRTAIAVNYQHLFPNRFHSTGVT